MKRKTILILLMVIGILAFAFPGVVTAQSLTAPQPQTITGDQLVVGNNYLLKSGQTLDGSLVILGGNAVIESDAIINGDIALMGGNLDFAGEIRGNISFVGGNVELHSGSTVSGDINSLGGTLSGEQLATISGEIHRMTPRALMFNWDNPDVTSIPRRGLFTSLADFFGGVLSKLLQTLGMAVLALLLGLIIAKPLDRISRSFTKQPWMSGGVGLLTLFLAPFVLVILSVTIILIPVTVLAVIGLVIAVIIGWVAVGYEVGRRMEILFKTEWADPVSAGLGTLVLGLAVWLVSYVPCIGWLAGLVVASLGLGGIIMSRFGTQEYTEKSPPVLRSTPVVPPSMPPVEPVIKGEALPEMKPQDEESDEKPENPSE